MISNEVHSMERSVPESRLAVNISPNAKGSVDGLVKELHLLCKGYGLRVGQAEQRLGPMMRAVCEINERDNSATALDKATRWMRDHAALLAPGLGIVILGAFGLHRDAQHRFLNDRIVWVAESLDCGVRTVRRRLNEAIRQLADMATRGDESAAIDISSFLGHLVEIIISPDGLADQAQVRPRGRIAGVARDIDSQNRIFAIFRPLGEAYGVAIPLIRIRRIERIVE